MVEQIQKAQNPYKIKDFFDKYMVTNIDFEKNKYPDASMDKLRKAVKKQNKKILSAIDSNDIALTSTKHEILRNPALTNKEAQNLAIKKNNLLIAKMQNIAANYQNHYIIIYEKYNDFDKRIIFSRDINPRKNEILLFLGLWGEKTEIKMDELEKIAIAYSSRLGQRKNHANSIIRKSLKAFEKGNKIFYEIIENEKKSAGSAL